MRNKKIFSKLLCGALSATCCVSATACGGDFFGANSGQTSIEEGKEGIYVGVYDGALGADWAHELEKMFEAKYSNVDVVIRAKKTDYDDALLVSNMRGNDEDIYFLSSNILSSYTSAGLIADLTDVVTADIFDNDGNLVDSGATKSIEDTMYPKWRDIYKNEQGKYYAIPNFTPISGIWYDADLFEEAGYTVPTTYSEFKTLLDRIVIDGYTPISAAASYQYIINNSALSFHANVEGVDNFWLNSTFSGTDSALGEINISNAGKLADQDGHRATLQFLYDIATNDSYTTSGTRAGQTHTEAQDSFVQSIDSGTGRIAMFIENSFWEREAKNTMDAMGEYEPEYGFGKRNFKYMVAPVDNKKTDRTTIYMGYAESFVCINANSKRSELAKKFLQFAQSREALVKYTQYTSTLRPYDYTFTEEEYNACTPMTQSMVDLKRDSNVDFVTHAALNSVLKKIPQHNDGWFFSEGSSALPFSKFRNSSMTVAEYISKNKSANSKYFD